MAIKEYKLLSGEVRYQVYVKRRKRGTTIFAQRKKKGITTHGEAKREEKKLARVCDEEIDLKFAQGATLASAIDRFEEYLHSPTAKILHETTRQDYVDTARKLLRPLLNRQAASITRSEYDVLFAELKLDGYSKGHLSKFRGVINRIYSYGIEKKIITSIQESPALGLSLGKSEQKKTEVLTLDQLRLFLSAARAVGHPWTSIWAMAAMTGMRSGELKALLWTQVDLENNNITVSRSYNGRLKIFKCTKARYWRTVPINRELRKVLLELKSNAGDRPEVLPQLTGWKRGEQARILRHFLVGIGLPPIKFHALRACFATQLMRMGVPPIQVQKIAGWKDIKTMERYVNLAAIEVKGATDALSFLPDNEAVDLFVTELAKPDTAKD